MKTVDGGLHWKEISPDLTGAVKGEMAKGGVGVNNARELGFGVVYTIAPSSLKTEQIWAASDTGLIYAVVDRHRLDDNRPYGFCAASRRERSSCGTGLEHGSACAFEEIHG